MYSALRYSLDRLSKDTFNALCMAILRKDISPHVRQVSPSGKDDRRDATLEGIASSYSQTPRCWIFQFKQYQSEINSARSKCLKDFKEDIQYIFDKYPQTQAYIFLTCVPFSGNPQTGLYDKIQILKNECSYKYNAIIDFWDGCELCNHIDSAPKFYRHFFYSIEIINPIEYNGGNNSLDYIKIDPTLENIDFIDKSISDLTIEWLFPVSGIMLGPSGVCPIWTFAQWGRNQKLILVCNSIHKVVCKKITDANYDNHFYRAYLWANILLTYADLQTGRLSHALSCLKKIETSLHKQLPPEYHAWYYNLLSIYYGKLGCEDNAKKAGQKGIVISELGGLFWLSAIIKLRLLHKEDWHKSEKGTQSSHELFNMQITDGIYSKENIDYATQLHLIGLIKSIKVLHYTWNPESKEVTLNDAKDAIKLLSIQPDHDEKNKMISEIGRLQLFSFQKPLEAIEEFRKSALMRVSSNNLARLRYDLMWLAECFLRLEDYKRAYLCASSSILIHEHIFKKTKVDSHLVVSLNKIIMSCKDISKDRFFHESLDSKLELLFDASGIHPSWWEKFIRIH